MAIIPNPSVVPNQLRANGINAQNGNESQKVTIFSSPSSIRQGRESLPAPGLLSG
jgi:hypothetical protein